MESMNKGCPKVGNMITSDFSETSEETLKVNLFA